MNGFGGRIVKALSFEDALDKDLKKKNFHVARNGTEHTFPEFTNRLRLSDDPTSLAIRFQPDGIACIGRVPRSFYYEAKASRYIEKTAYEQYMAIREANGILVIVFEWDTNYWRWNFIENIKLIPGGVTVNRFPPAKRFPVRDDWIIPRGSKRWETIRSNSSQASGTPYREVDITSLLYWEEFESKIIERLKNVDPNVGTESDTSAMR